MSEKDQEVANFAIEEFTAKVRSVERLQMAQQLIASVDTVPQALRSEAVQLLSKMVESLDN